MRVDITEEGVTVHGSPLDGYRFATRPDAAWPGSVLRHLDKPFFFEFDKHGDLIDSNVDEEAELSANELTAFAEYTLTQARNSLNTAIEQQQRRFR